MGAGIMSATLGVILKELNPEITIQIFEILDEAGTESLMPGTTRAQSNT